MLIQLNEKYIFYTAVIVAGNIYNDMCWVFS